MENQFDDHNEENFLSNIDKKQPFLLPNNYFDSLNERLINKLECEEELTVYKTLSKIDKEQNFTIPENYFENLKNKLEYKYEISNFEELVKVPKNSFNEPSADYFEQLESNINHKLELDSELQEFKILSGLEKKNPFSVDANYFEKRTEKIITQNKTSKIVQFKSFVFNPKLAIAASLITIVGAVAFWKLNNNNSTIIQASDCKTLACLEKYELLNEKNIDDFDDENLYEMVDIEELDKKIGIEDNMNDSIGKGAKNEY